LKTPIDYDIRTIQGGLYHHFGLQSALIKILNSCKPNCKRSCELQLNIDGQPIFKNSGTHFWPILWQVISSIVAEPFVMGLLCGERKPKDISEYLHDLVSELEATETDGLTLYGFSILIRISVSCVICDARAYIKQVKQYNAYFGCDKCTHKGEWHEKVTFPEFDVAMRTDVHFDELQRKCHNVHSDGESPLADTSLGMVTNSSLEMVTNSSLEMVTNSSVEIRYARRVASQKLVKRQHGRSTLSFQQLLACHTMRVADCL